MTARDPLQQALVGYSMNAQDPLYHSLVAYEDAANEVGGLTVSVSGAYCGLTDAIKGYGGLEDAKYRFAMEATLLADAYDHWKQAQAALLAQIEDGVAWQNWFTAPRKRCINCGTEERYANRFGSGWCSDCVSNFKEAADQVRGNPFEEVARQSYGERGVLGTEQL